MSHNTDVSPAFSQLGDSLARAAETQRLLFQEMTSFVRDEGLRFTNCRLERNGEAMEKMQNCQGLPGLIGVQQEWLRGFVEDYLAQQMRLAGAFRGIAHNVVASAAETASENIDRMQQESQRAAEVAGHEMNRMADTAGQQMDQTAQDAQQANTYVQGTQH
jgi:hypothetical protein